MSTIAETVAQCLPDSVGRIVPTRHRDAHDAAFHADGIVVTLPKALAGLGTQRQLESVWNGLSELSDALNIPLHYIGPRVRGSRPLDPLVPIAVDADLARTYEANQNAFTHAFGALAGQGHRRLVIVSMGYTSIGPEGIRRALDSQPAPGIDVKLYVVDSAFPDVDGLGTALGSDGWPTSRFHEQSYEPTENLTIEFLLTSSYPYAAELLNRRLPPVTRSRVIAPPYTDDYLQDLQGWANRGRTAEVSELVELLPALTSMRSDDLLIPLLSSDIWSEDAVNSWMRVEEYETVKIGTATLFEALVVVALERGARVWVPVDSGCAQFLETSPIERVAAATDLDVPANASVIIVPYRDLSQANHACLLGWSDIAISRTGGQSNASAVLALCEVPALVMDLPAAGYMQAELTSAAGVADVTVSPDGTVEWIMKDVPLFVLEHWDHPVDDVAESIKWTLNGNDRALRTSAARQAFLQLRSTSTLYSLIRHDVCDD